jgi:hypothetical protein
MTPNVTSSRTEVLYTPETTRHSSSEIRDGVEKPALKYRREIVWPNVVLHLYINVAALYGAYLIFSSAKILTTVWGMCHRLSVVYSLFICGYVSQTVCSVACLSVGMCHRLSVECSLLICGCV